MTPNYDANTEGRRGQNNRPTSNYLYSSRPSGTTKHHKDSARFVDEYLKIHLTHLARLNRDPRIKAEVSKRLRSLEHKYGTEGGTKS